MSLIEDIRRKVAADEFEVTCHVRFLLDERGISQEDVRQVIASGEVLADYPNDKFGASCLILGYTDTGQVLHVLCKYSIRKIVRIIVVYEPMSSRLNCSGRQSNELLHVRRR